MTCPWCGSEKNKVTDVRQNTVETIRRRRECLECRNRWTTEETEIRKHRKTDKLKERLK